MRKSIQPSDTSFVLAWLERVDGLPAFGAFVVYTTKGRYNKVFTNLSDIIKIPVAVIAGLILAVLVYEGLRLPWIGQVIPGVVWFRVDAAKSTMVTTFERDALQAQLDKERRDRASAEVAATEAKKRADATLKAKEQADAKVAELEAEARKANLPGWTQEELEWFGKH
ncbi:hypothetical protein JZX87_10140 [Agrobacterium sp. Ap1]|uniref:hypothetical protein n=1 Tax=Agrobacterium sp. Ap1 TaxID=2815337 RepID=UPI001A8CE9C4|nr:hypothetical protein [Agrobacterium sp. Ap1]MBO0141522.1 hypothetical protein [Agrobacterium sp. Ap1]